MGEVWLATYDGPGGFHRQVVLKTVRPDLAERADLVDTLLREAALAARLSHPNLVQIFDLDCVDGTYFFAMEYVAGRTLTAVLQQAAAISATVAPWFLASVVASTCDGLHHAHELVDERGQPLHLVHGDVTPSNIMVATSGHVVLLDLGIGAAGIGAEADPGVLDDRLQSMAPERIQGAACDVRCDVYALGVILYRGLTGCAPYTATDEYDLIQQIAAGPPPPPSDRRPLLPAALERICRTAMAHDPAQRHADAAALSADLRDWLRARGEQPTSGDLARYVARLFREDASGVPLATDVVKPPTGSPRRYC